MRLRKRPVSGTVRGMRLLPGLALALLAAPAAAQEAPEPVTPASVVAAAPPSDWRRIEPADLLVMDLAPDRDGQARRVVIQLMPPPFSQGWVENVRTLAKTHWWDGTSVYRVVDNWVAQWGDADETKSLPEGVVSPVAPYFVAGGSDAYDVLERAVARSYVERLPADHQAALLDDSDEVIPSQREKFLQEYLGMARTPDNYAEGTVFLFGWPFASNASGVWPIHCYGSVGVARDTETTGTGSELYAVIGHAPRQLDRNIAVVGRVIEGIEHLSTLPRGKGEAGVYDDPALRVPIVSVRLGNEVPELPQPVFEYLASDSASFAEYVRVRANRNDAFYKVPAGGIDVCNVQVPIRRVPSE
jgi:peptidylprolyl isomerase